MNPSRKRRLFVALQVSDELKRTVRQWQLDHETLDVRWIPQESLHYTLIPPWTTDDVEAYRQRFSAYTPDLSPISVMLSAIGTGPTGRHPRLIWATGTAPTAIIRLERDLREVLDLPVVTGRKRAFVLHLTVARFHTDRQPTDTGLPEPVSWHDTIRHIVLTESVQTDAGSVYEPLSVLHLREVPLYAKY